MDTGLTGIQLVFEDGLKSPLIDAENVNSTDLVSYPLENDTINFVYAGVFDQTWPFSLAVCYHNG